MKNKFIVQNIIIDDFGQFKKSELLFLPVSDQINFLLIDENLGLKNELKNITKLYYEDNSQALIEFYNFRNSLIEKIKGLDFINNANLIEITDVFVESEWILEDEPQDEFPYVHDQIVSIIPLVLSRVVAIYFEKKGYLTRWIDNRDFVVTDENFTSAGVNYNDSQQKWSKISATFQQDVQIIVSQKNIGSTVDNTTTISENIDFEKILF